MTTLSGRQITPSLSKLGKIHNFFSLDMGKVATIILGGGQGSRLAPLTIPRCKPAVCFGGKYRLIDIPMSNAINSGCEKIFILTQFLSTSLNQHILKTYRPGTFSSASIELLPAEQGPYNRTWFQGTADAVRQNLPHFLETPADYFLILSGDQLYNLNFQDMVQFAKETEADLVIAALPVNGTDAKRMGLLKVNEDNFITEFCEKPQEKQLLERMRLPDFTLKQFKSKTDKQKRYLGSMGIYLFKRKALFDLLKLDKGEDFGHHLIPTQVKKGNTAAYLFNGYWEDIGTISSYYHANMALTESKPLFNCYGENGAIFSQPYHLPPPKISGAEIKESIICEGAIVAADVVSNTILGPRTVIKDGSIIKNSYVMGNDHYYPLVQEDDQPLHYQIGEECIIENAIIDKKVSIGNRVQLINKQKLTDFNGDLVSIKDGIIIVHHGATLPDGFIL